MKILMIEADQPTTEIIDQAASILAGGGVVVAPSETRYGLLGRADSLEVLERIFDIKKREASSPVAVFLSNADEIAKYAEFTACARKLSAKFLPGPLTLVLKAKNESNPWLVADGKIGIRISSSPVINKLLTQTGTPLCATSANISGEESSDSISCIARELGDKVDLYLDGGMLSGPVSTVVDISTDIPVVLRAGAIDREEIEMACK